MKRLILLPAVVGLALLSACGNGQNNQQSQSSSGGSEAGGATVSRDSTGANDGPAANSEDKKIDPEG